MKVLIEKIKLKYWSLVLLAFSSTELLANSAAIGRWGENMAREGVNIGVKLGAGTMAVAGIFMLFGSHLGMTIAQGALKGCLFIFGGGAIVTLLAAVFGR